MLDFKDIKELGKIFFDYGYVMTTAQLQAEQLYYADIQLMMSEGMIDKFYHWIEDWNGNEVIIINQLFTDAVLCMEIALFHYEYSDRNPAEWGIAIDKNVSKQRTKIDCPFVKVY